MPSDEHDSSAETGFKLTPDQVTQGEIPVPVKANDADDEGHYADAQGHVWDTPDEDDE